MTSLKRSASLFLDEPTPLGHKLFLAGISRLAFNIFNLA